MNGGVNTNDTGFTQLPGGGMMPWNPPEPTQCDNDGVMCETCVPVAPTPPPNPTECHNEIWGTDLVFDGSCWWNVRHWVRLCDLVVVDQWDEWDIWYCLAD